MKYAHINALRDNLVNIYIYSRLFNRVFTRAVELGFKNPGFSFFKKNFKKSKAQIRFLRFFCVV